LTNLQFSQVSIDKIKKKIAKIERDKAIKGITKELLDGYGLSLEDWIIEIDQVLWTYRNNSPPLNYRQILSIAEDEIVKGILQHKEDTGSWF
jgi:hypothetical protein